MLTIVRNLRWIVSARILKKDPEAKVVISGDFNVDGLPYVIKALKGTDIVSVIPQEESTHSRGGHLDNIFTNLQVTDTQILDFDASLSDHKAISCKLTYRKEEQKQVFANQKTFYTW